MPTYNYAVDYTGLNPANLISNEVHTAVSNNFRTYKVIIPEFAPFFGASVAIRHPVSNRLLVEGEDYYLTHLYVEATKSIGRDIYGSISITNGLSGIFEITYQTVGGEWTLPGATISGILANLMINPRIARWTQVALYPAVFPSINHNTDAVDLTGMAQIVEAIDDVTQAIEDRPVAAGGSSVIYANDQVAVAGVSDSAVLTAKSGKAAILANINDIRTNEATSKLVRDCFGKAVFIKDGFKVYRDGPTHKVHRGIGYINGVRVEVPEITPTFNPSTPLDIFTSATSWESQSSFGGFTAYDARNVTNLLHHGSLVRYPEWTKLNDDSNTELFLEYNKGYDGDADLKYSLLKAITIGPGSYQPVTISTVFDVPEDATLLPDRTVRLSFYCRTVISGATAKGRVNIGDTTNQQSFNIDSTMRRVVIDCLYVGGDRLYFTLETGYVVIGDFQLEVLTDTINLPNVGGSTNTNLNISGLLPTPWSKGVYGVRFRENTVVGEHSLSTSYSVEKGQVYKFTYTVKPINHSELAFYTTGTTIANGLSVIAPASTAGLEVTTRAQAHTFLNVRTPLDAAVAAAGFKVVEFIFQAFNTGLATFTMGGFETALSYPGAVNKGMDIARWNLVKYEYDGYVPWLKLESTNWVKTSGIRVAKNRFLDRNDQAVAAKLIATKEYMLDHSVSARRYWADNKTVLLTGAFLPDGVSKIRLEIAYIHPTGGYDDTTASYTLDLNQGPGVVGAVGGNLTVPVGTISDLTNGWKRVSFSVTTKPGIGTSELRLSIYLLSDYNVTTNLIPYAGDDERGVLVSDLAIEQQTTPSLFTFQSPKVVSELVRTTNAPVTDLVSIDIPSYVDKDNNTVAYAKLATIFSNQPVIDRRVVLQIGDNDAINAASKYSEFTTGTVLTPNANYWIAADQNALLPPASTLNKGDVFYFEKPMGSTVTISVSDLTNDLIYARDYDNDTIISDTSIQYNEYDAAKVIFNGTDFEIRF